ncbi:MAG: hypothetical protein ABEH81_01490 [Halopenitus sp.]
MLAEACGFPLDVIEYTFDTDGKTGVAVDTESNEYSFEVNCGTITEQPIFGGGSHP